MLIPASIQTCSSLDVVARAKRAKNVLEGLISAWMAPRCEPHHADIDWIRNSPSGNRSLCDPLEDTIYSFLPKHTQRRIHKNFKGKKC